MFILQMIIASITGGILAFVIGISTKPDVEFPSRNEFIRCYETVKCTIGCHSSLPKPKDGFPIEE